MDRLQILALAARPDGILVHRYSYRDEPTREKVYRLRREKKLARIGAWKESDRFAITDAGREHLEKVRGNKKP